MVKTFLVLSLALPAPAGACLDAAGVEAALARVRAATVKVTAKDGSVGTAFFIRDAEQGLLATAHHVPAKGAAGSCRDKTSPKIEVKDRFDLSRLRASDGRDYAFAVAPGRFDWGNDALTTPASPSRSVEPLAPSSAPQPRVGEDVAVSGFPFAKKGFTQHRCKVIGYSSPLNGQSNPSLVLACPVNYDIAGMSGGPVVSLCTGQVVGLVSWQDYDGDCPKEGDARKVGASLIHADAKGLLAFGPSEDLVTTCWREGKRGMDESYPCQTVRGFFGETVGP